MLKGANGPAGEHMLVYVTLPHDYVWPPASADTPPGLSAARRLARHLVEEGLAAGINLLPGALSVYRWQGEVCEHGEILLLAQVAQDALPDFQAALRALHPYEVPCLVALTPDDGYPPFLDWIDHNSRPAHKRD